MALPGSYQVGLGAKLLQHYPWWKFEPHPEWVTPRGTTLFEPSSGSDPLHIDLVEEWGVDDDEVGKVPESEWKKHKGNYLLPYATGIDREVRVIYLPYFVLNTPEPPTVLKLEVGIPYETYYWEPSLGVKVDLGAIERPPPGKVLIESDMLDGVVDGNDCHPTGDPARGADTGNDPSVSLIKGVDEKNLVLSIEMPGTADAGIALRYVDDGNYIEGLYSPTSQEISLFERKNGVAGLPLGRTRVPPSFTRVRLTAELRNGMGIVSLTAAGETYTTPIVAIGNAKSGQVGLISNCGLDKLSFSDLLIRESPSIPPFIHGPITLIAAQGRYRGRLAPPGGPVLKDPIDWASYGRDRHLLLDAYRPEPVPMQGDWVLIMDARRPTSPVAK